MGLSEGQSSSPQSAVYPAERWVVLSGSGPASVSSLETRGDAVAERVVARIQSGLSVESPQASVPSMTASRFWDGRF